MCVCVCVCVFLSIKDTGLSKNNVHFLAYMCCFWRLNNMVLLSIFIILAKMNGPLEDVSHLLSCEYQFNLEKIHTYVSSKA